MNHALWSCLLAALITASCGSDPSPTVGMARTALASLLGTAKPTAPPQITRALLAQVVTPVMLVTVDDRNQQALIAEIQTNRGVATWSSVDDITLSLRNGVIVATRGFGADLMAADVPDISGRSGGKAHSRVHTLLNGEDRAVQTSYVCGVRSAGIKMIEIVEISYETTHIIESCAGGGLRFVNDFWFTSDQTLRKSRQWVSPDVGFLTIEDVRR